MVEAKEPEDQWVDDYSYMRNAPTGPMKWVHQFGCYVREFDDPCTELLSGQFKDTLQYHVPQQFRGKYRPEQLPSEYLPGVIWDVDHDSYVLCTGITLRATKCRKLAVNRSGYCESHGGALHPHDKVRWIGETQQIGSHHQINIRESKTGDYIDRLTRWQQLQMGIITVEDLDDEELARGQCRGPSGRFGSKPPAAVPRDLHDQMMKQLLSRAQQKFREGLLGSIDALVSIAKGDAYEPADRIKASTLIIERVMGKTPDVLLTAETKAPWEEIFSAISRDTGENAAYKRIEAAIDAEVVDGEDWSNKPGEEGAYNRPRKFGPPPNDGQYEAKAEQAKVPKLANEPVTPPPMQAGPWITPPQDPVARDQYEKLRGSVETRESLKDRIKEGRARRYAARAVGRETTENLPYAFKLVEIHKPTDEIEGLYRVKFVAPEDTKVPVSVLTQETRRRKYERG